MVNATTSWPWEKLGEPMTPSKSLSFCTRPLRVSNAYRLDTVLSSAAKWMVRPSGAHS
ncbi:MAG: hypothetical protein P8099_14420 [Gemmatimonadota bacterium]